ncbi:MAG: hypothetical protein DRP91_09690 [Candidatus Neomarinimicrobiota bacterium]|nr:hypothetical protein [Candidatus Neomarinimicrobiota bacterium]RKY45684.1 MAG: hypothetical protein DRP91_09690 [Candidatus Neomarinimicrobiota bacterium]
MSRKKIFSLLTLGLLLVFTSSIAIAGSLEETLRKMAKDNAKLYVKPLANAFGCAINSGWYHSASTHKLLGFDISLKIAAVPIPDEEKSFEFVVSDFSQTVQIGGQDYTLSLDGETLYPERNVPTVFGADKNTYVEKADVEGITQLFTQQLIDQGMSSEVVNSEEVQNQLHDIAYNIPNLGPIKGFDLDYFPLPIPQISLGLGIPMSPIKAEIVARGLPNLEIKDLGEIKTFGGGIKLRLDPFVPIPMFPLRITAGAFMQNLSLGDILESTHSHFSILVGRDVNFLLFGAGLYAGYGIESSSYEVSYDYEISSGEVQHIEFKMDGDNESRIILGGKIKFSLLNISIEYAKGYYDIYTAGVGISFR